MKCIQYQPLSVLQLPAHTGVPEQREYILPVHNPEWAGYSKSTIGTKIRDSFLTCFMYDTLFVTIKVPVRLPIVFAILLSFEPVSFCFLCLHIITISHWSTS